MVRPETDGSENEVFTQGHRTGSLYLGDVILNTGSLCLGDGILFQVKFTSTKFVKHSLDSLLSEVYSNIII